MKGVFSVVLLSFLLCFQLPNKAEAASWMECSHLLAKLQQYARNKSVEGSRKTLEKLDVVLQNATGSTWRKLAIIEAELYKLLSEMEGLPGFDKEVLVKVHRRLQGVRIQSIGKLAEDLHSEDAKIVDRAISSIQLALLREETTAQTLPLYLSMFDDPRAAVRGRATIEFWPVYAFLETTTKGFPKLQASTRTLKTILPRFSEFWINFLEHEIQNEIAFNVDTPELSDRFRQIGEILTLRERHISFEDAVDFIDTLFAHYDVETDRSFYLNDFATRLEMLAAGGVPIPYRVEQDHMLISFSGELYLLAHDPQISEKTKDELRVITSFLLEKLKGYASQDISEFEAVSEWHPEGETIQKQSYSRQEQIAQRDEAQAILEAFDNRPRRLTDDEQIALFLKMAFEGDKDLETELKAWLVIHPNGYSAIHDPVKGRLLHEVAEIAGHKALSERLMSLATGR
jgi:hypothetical protein